MAEGHGREQWNHTSSLMWIIAMVNRDPKKGRKPKPEHFNPYAGKRRRPKEASREELAMLRQALEGRERMLKQ